MESVPPLFGGGRKTAAFVQSKLRAGKDFTILSTSNAPSVSTTPPFKTKKRKSVMPESAPNTKKETSKDKCKTSKKRTRRTRSSKTLGQASTGTARALLPFWTEFSREVSEKLSLPTATACVDLGTNLWNASSRRLGHNSWFKMRQTTCTAPPKNCQTTFSQSSQSLWQEITDVELRKTVEKESFKPKRKSYTGNKRGKTKKPPAGKSKRIRIYPTRRQKKTLYSWYGTARWTYNKCMEATVREKRKANKKTLRAYCLNGDSELLLDETTKRWVEETPYEVRDAAMSDFLTAFRINLDLVKQKKRERFEMKWRSRKQRSQTIRIRYRDWNTPRSVYSEIFAPSKLRSSELLQDSYTYDLRLQLTRLGEFYLCIPSALEMLSDNQAPSDETEGIISLDPGVRTFLTCYDPSTEIYSEWGKGDMGRIYRLCHYYDNLQSRRTRIRTRRNRYRMKRAGLKILRKIRNLVDDLHKKCVKWLCENFRVVLLPLFETSKMIRRGQRRLNSKTARAISTWSHYRFRQRLLNKAREYPWCKIVIVTEEYTSKTCGGCGYINEKLGGAKVYWCPRCRVHMDRDFNGARNIFLKYLTEMSERV